MKRLRLFPLLLVVASCAPAPGSFFLVVNAPLRVPQDCDALRVEVRRGDATGEVQLDHTYPVASGTNFPLTLQVDLSNAKDLAPTNLHISTWAQHDSALAASWAQGTTDVAIAKSTNPTVTLSLHP